MNNIVQLFPTYTDHEDGALVVNGGYLNKLVVFYFNKWTKGRDWLFIPWLVAMSLLLACIVTMGSQDEENHRMLSQRPNPIGDIFTYCQQLIYGQVSKYLPITSICDAVVDQMYFASALFRCKYLPLQPGDANYPDYNALAQLGLFLIGLAAEFLSIVMTAVAVGMMFLVAIVGIFTLFSVAFAIFAAICKAAQLVDQKRTGVTFSERYEEAMRARLHKNMVREATANDKWNKMVNVLYAT